MRSDEESMVSCFAEIIMDLGIFVVVWALESKLIFVIHCKAEDAYYSHVGNMWIYNRSNICANSSFY